MKNPYMKIFWFHLIFTLTTFLPLLFIPVVGYSGFYTVCSSILLVVGNLWLTPFLQNSLFKYDVVKWKYSSEKDLQSWKQEKDLEVSLNMTMIEDLKKLEFEKQKELLSAI